MMRQSKRGRRPGNATGVCTALARDITTENTGAESSENEQPTLKATGASSHSLHSFVLPPQYNQWYPPPAYWPGYGLQYSMPLQNTVAGSTAHSAANKTTRADNNKTRKKRDRSRVKEGIDCSRAREGYVLVDAISVSFAREDAVAKMLEYFGGQKLVARGACGHARASLESMHTGTGVQSTGAH